MAFAGAGFVDTALPVALRMRPSANALDGKDDRERCVSGNSKSVPLQSSARSQEDNLPIGASESTGLEELALGSRVRRELAILWAHKRRRRFSDTTSGPRDEFLAVHDRGECQNGEERSSEEGFHVEVDPTVAVI